jgi:hypothetical protein
MSSGLIDHSFCEAAYGHSSPGFTDYKLYLKIIIVSQKEPEYFFFFKNGVLVKALAKHRNLTQEFWYD